MIERLGVSWEDASLRVFTFAALAWLSASLASCTQASLIFVSKADVAITAAIPSPGPIMASIENEDPEFPEDELELCGLPSMWLFTPPSLTLSPTTPARIVFLSVPTPGSHPLRC